MEKPNNGTAWRGNELYERAPRMVFALIIQIEALFYGGLGMLLLMKYLPGSPPDLGADARIKFLLFFISAVAMSAVLGAWVTFGRLPQAVLLDEQGITVKRRMFRQVRIPRNGITEFKVTHNVNRFSYGRGVSQVRIYFKPSPTSLQTALVLLVSDARLVEAVGARVVAEHPLNNGGLRVRLLELDLSRMRP